MGGSAVPLNYCHRLSTTLLDTSSSFSCAPDKSGVLMNQFTSADCSGDPLYSVDPTNIFNVEGYDCNGDYRDCDRNSVEVQIYVTPQCSGNNWSSAKFLTEKCLEAADGGSQKYVCTDRSAQIMTYSDNHCRQFTDIIDVELVNCFDVIACNTPSNTIDSSSTLPVLRVSTTTSTSTSTPTGIDEYHHHTVIQSVQPVNMFSTVLIIVIVLLAIAILLAVVYCCRRKRRRLEDEIADMTVNRGAVQYPYRENIPSDPPQDANNQYMVQPQGEGAQSDVVITAFAT
jgi:hypothetical protein